MDGDPGQGSGFRIDVLGRIGRPIRTKGRISQVQVLHIGCRAVAPYGFTGPFVFSAAFYRDRWLMMFRALPAVIGADRIITVDATTGASTIRRGH